MNEFGFDTSAIEGVDISPSDFSENFSLPTVLADERKEFTMTFLLHENQAALIRQAMNYVEEPQKTFGNTNQAGNAIYEIVRQWTELHQ